MEKNNETLKIKKENVLNAYGTATDEQKAMLEIIFGKDTFKPKDITERVKTIEDAVAILGNDNQAVIDYYNVTYNPTASKDILAFVKLRVIADALNEGWKPTFERSEYRYFPWFYTYTKKEYEALDEAEKSLCRVVGRAYYNAFANGGIAYAYAFSASSNSNTYFGSRLAFKSKALAEYCGKQFIDIWADFLLG